jgi:hypothetical protein
LPSPLRTFAILGAFFFITDATPVQAAGLTTLSINTSPPGAEVFHVDTDSETSLGFTPIAKVRLPRGTVTLRVEMEGYEELLEPVEVGRKSQNLLFNLVRKIRPGSLKITTSKLFKGAKLKIDGKFLGPLPQDLQVSPGRHQAVVYLKGYKKWIRWIDVAEGQKQVFEVVLEAKEDRRGSLMVASTPSGANVFINQEPKGKTPLALDNMAADNYFVEVRKEGHLLWKKAVRIEAGKRAIVDATLEKAAAAPSMLKVSVDIANAEIYLDGRLVGKSPSVSLEVTPGDHEVEIRPTGDAPKKKSLRVEAGKTLEVTFQFKPATPPKAADGSEEKSAEADASTKPPAAPPMDPATTPPAKDAKEASPSNTATDPAEVKTGRAMPSSAIVAPNGQGALYLSFGYPYLAGLSASAGLIEDLQLAFAFRSIAHVMNEFEVQAKYALLRTDSFAIAAEAGIGFGLGTSERNSFLMSASGLATLLLGDKGALTTHVSLRFFNDRNGPESEAVYAERTNVLQMLLGLTLELGISPDWNMSLRFEGDPIGGSSCEGVGRCLYEEEFLKDANMYGHIGFTHSF